MRLSYLLIAAAGSALIAGSAMAQDQASPAPMTPDQGSGTAGAGAAMATDVAPVTLPASSSTLGDPTLMKAGEASVVSNGPVPDTAENRAKYGRPMSNAGKKSSPAGN